jgi:tetratricopeptide (TPR) repeat protein
MFNFKKLFVKLKYGAKTAPLLCAALFGAVLFAAACCLSFAQPAFCADNDTETAAGNYMQKQQYSKAAELYSQLLSDDTDNVHLLFNYGTSLSFVNQQTHAIEILSKCSLALEKKLAAKNDSVEAELLAHVYNNLSKCYMSVAEYDAAVAACEKGIKRFNNLSWLYYNLGEALLLKGDPKNALLNFQKAIALDPSDISANLKIVECHYASQNYNEAGKILVELSRFYPENSEILFNLGSIYYKQNKADEAIKIWKSIAEREPESKFGKISKNWLLELKVTVDTTAKLLAETVECRLMSFSFVKPHNFYIAKASETDDNSIYMLSAHIYDESSKNTAEISLSISAQTLSEPQDYKQFAKNWQKNQEANGQNFELIAEKEMPAGRNSKPAMMWEYSAIYNGVHIKGATIAFLNKNYAVLIWLNATPATFSKAIESFYSLAKSFDDINK